MLKRGSLAAHGRQRDLVDIIVDFKFGVSKEGSTIRPAKKFTRFIYRIFRLHLLFLCFLFVILGNLCCCALFGVALSLLESFESAGRR